MQRSINVHNQLKTENMKLVKLSMLALTMSLFVVSCGGGEGEKPAADTVAAAPATPTAEPTPAPTPADTTAKPATDTAKAAPAAAPATETKK